MHAADINVLTEDHSSDDRWFITNGVQAVGPVTFELMTRGVAAGRIPPGSFVRHATWKVWRRMEELEGLSAEHREAAVAHLAEVSAEAEVKASSPNHAAPPPPSAEELETPANDSKPPSLRPAAVDPVGVLASADDLDQALLLALSTAVTASAAHVGFCHLVRPDLAATVTSFTYGPGTEQLLGERLADNDAALLAAQAGHTVMGELRLGEAGRYIAGRVARVLPGPRGVAMVPLMLHGGLAAMIEVARTSRPFRAREIARVEDVVEALAERLTVTGWLG